MSHILITDGAGFIGSHLAEYYALKGDRVMRREKMEKGFLKKLVLGALFSLLMLFPGHESYGRVVLDLNNGKQDMIIYGDQMFDGLGYPVFAADINGDGLKDIIVSATANDGPDHLQVNRGTIYIIFGKLSPLPASLNLPHGADLIIYGEEHGINGAEGDEAGYALAAADLNGDGIDDLIISSIYADGPNNSRPDAGEVYVIYGRSTFPQEMYLPVDSDIVIYGAKGGQGGDPENPDKGDMTGFALATGDLNHDGFKDIVITGILGDGPQNDRPHSGTTYIVWGTGQLPPVIDLANDSNVTTIWGAEAGDYSGFALFVKDLNQDGIDDLMIGAVGADGPSNSRENCGEVYILYGRPFFPTMIDLTMDADVIIYGARAGDQGFNPVNYIGSGDINGDGIPDLIIGAPFSDGENIDTTDSGAVYIVFGKGSPLPKTIDLANDTDVVIYGRQPGDKFGFSIAIGDVNGDKKADLIISAPSAGSLYGWKQAGGEAYVFYGRTQFPSIMNASDSDILIYGADPFDLLGVSLYSADVNNDGVEDLLIGVPNSNGFLNLTEGAGEVAIIFGVKGGIGLEAISPINGEVVSCQPVFRWTPGRPNNNIWAFQLFQAPDGGNHLHTSPFLLEPTYALPDNFIADIPANRPLYWKVYGVNPNESPMRVEESLIFSFTRKGLHLLSLQDSVNLQSLPTLEWTQGCSENTSWVVGTSLDPAFTSFLAISPLLSATSWTLPDALWNSLPEGVPIYWMVLGYYQPVPWRVLLDWSQERWSFIKENPK